MSSWNHTLLAPLVGALLVITAAQASAQPAHESGNTDWPPPAGTPYSPAPASVSDLITDGTFTKNPFSFPFDTGATVQAPRRGRIDFRVDLNVERRTVITHFQRAYQSRKPALSFQSWALPKDTDPDLYVTGLGRSGDVRIISLAHPPTSRRFTMELLREGGSPRLYIRNQTITRIFGAMTPSRAPFQPIDADPVPLFYE